MKTKGLVFVGLILQFGFLLFVLVQAPEPRAAIKIGIEHLQESSPSQAPSIDTTTGKTWVIKTAGDFFLMADNWFHFIIGATVCFTLLSMVISILLLVTLRRKKEEIKASLS
jgi:hypothetical protein